MPRFRVYIEEVSTRLFSHVIDASTPAEADAWARAALEDDTWSDEWPESSSECNVETREELTAMVDEDGAETVPRSTLVDLARVLELLPDSLKATLEHPGYLSIPLASGVSATFGTANGYWGGEVVNDAGEILASEVPLRPWTPDTPRAVVAKAIEETVAQLKGTT